MQTFIYGLLLAGISGVTIVAFRHPNGFARLFPYLLAVVTVLFVCVTVWHIAVEVTWTKLLPYTVPETLAEATNTKRQLRLPYAWVALWYLGVVAFLWINLKLPPFLQVADENSTQIDEGNSH